MIEIIDSKVTQAKFAELGFTLTDFQKATLIWNKPNITRQERISALADLATETGDENLKLQINERIKYEEKAINRFESNSSNDTVYVVFDSNDHCACGYFGEYDLAFDYAKGCINKEKLRYEIEKHKIVNGKTIPSVKTSFRINPNLLREKQDALVEYSGEPVACLYLNEKAEVTNLWSNEMDIREDEKVDECRKERFEYHFIKLPYIHNKGLIVKYLPTGEYGIIGTSADEWERFSDRVDNGIFVDFSDVAITVYFLSANGYWSHQHCNPIYLEAEKPDADIEDNKQTAFCRAMDAMSSYLNGSSDKTQEELVLRATREYAIVCEELTPAERCARKAKNINDILW